MQYRNDIQLLRGIAVALVLGYHFGVRGAANGFMGVDIFFVVSGFLMQKLYRPEQGAVDFWTRRARRLLPAYFTTLAATLSVGAVILLPDAFAQLRDQTAVAAVFGSNIGFWWAESYFQPKQFAPLLHLWSLGVELQYYLIVPLLVRILARFPRLLALLIIPLFLFCLAVVTVSPKTAFFMLPPRLWEFLLGAIVASWRGDTSLLPGWVSPVALLALIPMLVWPVDGTLTSILHGHPAIPVALVCLLTAIALAGTVEDRWLDNWPGRIAIGLGNISYSLYLVHFPLLVLANYRPFEGTHLGDGSPFQILVLLSASVLLAILLYAFVERRGPRWVTWPRVAIASSTLVTVAWIVAQAQIRLLDPYDRNVFYAFEDRAPYRCGKLFRILHPGESVCMLGSKHDATETVLLVGDSHSDAIKQSFTKAAEAHRIAVGLPVSNEPLLTPSLSAAWLLSEARNRGVHRIYFHYHYDHFTPSVIEQIEAIANAPDMHAIVIRPVPETAVTIPRMLFKAHHSGQPQPTISRRAYLMRSMPLTRLLRNHPGIVVIDPIGSLCSDSCPLASNTGRSYYFDENHLTLTGAKRLEPLFSAMLQRPPDRP